MLLFIDNDFVNVISVFHISIHLMLLFINVAKFEISPAPHFNTSHVTVYQGFHKTLHHLSIISIHLMLLFIFNTEAKERIGMINFNTSHVTVYRTRQSSTQERLWFQYISCYCLSWMIYPVQSRSAISIHLMLLFIPSVLLPTRTTTRFQYISCYCLSFPLVILPTSVSSFQYISCYCLSPNKS